MKTSQNEALSLLTFNIANYTFGVDVGNVISIMEYRKINKSLDFPKYILGSINVRNCEVPIFDLPKRLNIKKISEHKKNQSIILFHTKNNLDYNITGGIVDSINDVIHLKYNSNLNNFPDLILQEITYNSQVIKIINTKKILELNLKKNILLEEMH
ncbi:MAG: hypothetical protein A2X12_01630 [Bacteroidetes bacterium GWE2_29_8]|nr:MAG: hypothetical protein A2X12_01630 [Bacteroidetes bacterium GWE2_29_8]